MHTIKLLLTYYLNISVQAANLSDCRIESNRKNRFGSENRIESNRNFFCSELECLYLSRRRPTQTLLIMPMEIYEVTHIFTTFTNVFSYFGMLLMFLSLNKKFT